MQVNNCRDLCLSLHDFYKYTGPGEKVKDVANYKYLLDFRTALMNDEV